MRNNSYTVMEPVLIHFYAQDGFISNAIENESGGSYSHVSIELRGNVYEAIGGRLLGINGIVASPDAKSYHQGKHEAQVITVEMQFPLDMVTMTINYLNSRVGEKYGYRQLLTWVIPFYARRDNRVVCSQLVMQALTILTGFYFDTSKHSPSSIYDVVGLARRYRGTM